MLKLLRTCDLANPGLRVLVMAANLRPPRVSPVFIGHRQPYPEWFLPFDLAERWDIVARTIGRSPRPRCTLSPRQPLVPGVPSDDFVGDSKQLVHHAFLKFLSSLSLSGPRSSSSRRGGLSPRYTRAALVATTLVATTAISDAAPTADSAPQNVFAAALVEGRGVAPVPTGSPASARVLTALQAQSGSKEPISIVAQRILRFTQQARCGRISFALAQLNANRVWPAIGGHMNVCEDGQPPLRTCPEHWGVLVPVASVCANGKPPVDTDEVAAAIRSDVDAGGVTHEQMLHDWFKNLNAHAHASLTAPASSDAARANSEAPK